MSDLIDDGPRPSQDREQFASNLKKLAKDHKITVTLGQFVGLTEQAMRDNFSGKLKCENGRIAYHGTDNPRISTQNISEHQPSKHRRPRITRSATLISHR